MARQNLLFSLWKGVWIIAPWVAVAGSLYLVFGYHADPPQTGNPMRPKTWQEAERQNQAAGEERAQRKFWIEQVETGGMSFEEAGCSYRGGDWNFQAQTCDTGPVGLSSGQP